MYASNLAGALECINAGITKIATGRSGLSLISFNEHAHLEIRGREVVTYR